MEQELRQKQIEAFLSGYRGRGKDKESEGLATQDELKHDHYLFLRNFLVLLTSKGLYDARTRSVVKRLAKVLQVPWFYLARVENAAAIHLHDMWEASMARDKVHKGWRATKIGVAAVGGGLLIGLTAGLAAPALALVSTCLFAVDKVPTISRLETQYLILFVFHVGLGDTGDRRRSFIGNCQRSRHNLWCGRGGPCRL